MATTTVIKCLGTAGSAIGLTVLRKLAKEKKRLRRRFRAAPEAQRLAIQELLDRLERVIVRAVDVDPTTSFDVPEPLDNDVSDFPVATRIQLSMPGPDTVEGIQRGLYPNYQFLNPEAYQAMQAAGKGAGGTRVNGRLAAEAHRTKLENEIRSILESIASRRMEMADHVIEKVRLFLVAGLFGGFASGTYDYVRRLWMSIAADLKVEIEIVPFLLPPAAFRSDDPPNTNSLAYAVLKEYTAQATKLCWRREQPKDGPVPVNARNHWRPAFFVSDTNSAPGKPRILLRKNFHGMMAELLLQLALTGLGEKLESKLTDFFTAASALNSYGETRHGMTIGLSEIVLDRERAFRYLAATQCRAFLRGARAQAGEDLIRREVRAFLEARSIVLGDGRDDLANHLLDRRQGGDLVSLERVRELFRTNTHGLTGRALLQGGAEALEAAVQQNGDFVDALQSRAEAVRRAIASDALTLERAWITDPERGAGPALQWCATAGEVVGNMIAAAGESTAELEHRVTECGDRVDYFQNTYLPALNGKNGLYRWLHGRTIEANAMEYARALVADFEARTRLLAHQDGLACLNGISESLKQHQIPLQQALMTLEEQQAFSERELERVVNHSSDLEVPVGLALLAKPEEFEVLRQRLLPETAEPEAIRGLYLRLQQADDPFAVLTDAARLRDELETAAETNLRGKVDSLHVITELLRRSGEDRDTLGRILRERDLESTERLVLKDSSEVENGLVLVRLLGMDAGREDLILPVLNEFGQQRQHAYTHVNTGDPERIVFLQIRAAFPISDWAGCATAQQDYQNQRKIHKMERHHEFAGDRYLPELGVRRTRDDARLVALHAFLLNRLTWDASEWKLAAAEAGLNPRRLGSDLELLPGPEGFAVSVDVISDFKCFYCEHGPNLVRERLRRLDIPGEQQTETEREMSKLYTLEVRRKFEEELVWWEANTVPAAMEWGRKGMAAEWCASPLEK